MQDLIPQLRELYPRAEIIVVNDASTDRTPDIAEQGGARVVTHPYCMGNGAAIKTGVRAATGEIVVLMDADGQHDPKDIVALLERVEQGFDMVVGARDRGSHASKGRWVANSFYNWFASWVTGQNILDLTSGFRAARTEKFRQFLHLLPNGFSYPTTITMAFLRAGYPVTYVGIKARRRIGKSHIKLLRDGVRFLLIVFRVGTLYSPLKVFVPVSASFFLLGIAYYIFTFITADRFTNMSALLLVTSVIVFMIGLVSEQITLLNYRDRSN